MFFFCFYCRNSCGNVVDPVHPKVQENVDTIAYPCDGKRSSNSADIDGSEGSQTAAKIPRFELGVPTNNARDFSISMEDYLNKYMNIDIPYKNIREKISDKDIREKRQPSLHKCQGTPGSWQLYQRAFD